jgi:uncharacterized membrane protein affecting hemolysin expression
MWANEMNVIIVINFLLTSLFMPHETPASRFNELLLLLKWKKPEENDN